MDIKLSESPVKNSLIKQLSPSHSVQSEKNFFPRDLQQSLKTSMNGHLVNFNELSAKIEGVEKRLKGQECKTPLLRGSNKPGNSIDLMGKYKNKSKSGIISNQQIRSSWDNTIELNFLKDPEDVSNNEETYRMSFDLNTDFSSKAKLNNLMKNKFAGSAVGAMNKTLGLDREVPKVKPHQLSNSQVTFHIPDNSENLKERGKFGTEKQDKVKSRIQKSMEMLQFLKTQDFNKSKRQKPKNQVQKRQSEVINGFQLGRLIGKGKFGQVYLSLHQQTGFIAAIKKVLKQKLKQYNIVDQFIKEIKLHSALDHPKIVKFFGVFQEKDSFYLILQFMNGGTLFDYLNVVKTIKIKETVEFLKDIIDAVTQMHDRSIAHRDIKPQNIVINTEGVAKLCDFGWAAVIDKNRTTYCGTLEYASPQILQKKSYDESVDIWSLGILTYEMLMGRAPFQNFDRSLIKEKIMNMVLQDLTYSDNVPKEARDFIQWLVQKDPIKRPKIRELSSHAMFTKYGSNKNSKRVLQ